VVAHVLFRSENGPTVTMLQWWHVDIAWHHPQLRRIWYIYIHVRIKQQTLPITSKINRLWDWLNKVPLPASLVRAQPKAWVTASPNQDFLSGLWDRERSVSVSVIVAKSKQSDTKDWLETPVSQLVNVNATQHYWEAYCFLFCRKRMELQMNFIQDQICKCSILQIRPGHHF